MTLSQDHIESYVPFPVYRKAKKKIPRKKSCIALRQPSIKNKNKKTEKDLFKLGGATLADTNGISSAFREKGKRRPQHAQALGFSTCLHCNATFAMVYRIKFQSLDQSLLLFSLLYRCLSTIYSPLITISHGLFFCCFMPFFSYCTIAMVEVGLCRCQQTIPGTASELLRGEGRVKPQQDWFKGFENIASTSKDLINHWKTNFVQVYYEMCIYPSQFNG